MPRFRIRSLRWKLALQVLAVAALAVAALTVLAIRAASGLAERETYDHLAQVAARQAATLDGQVRTDLAAARTLAAQMEDTRGLTDERFIAELERVAIRNPQYIGVYGGWEPGVFPGEFAPELENVEGRAGAWWIRDGEKLTLEGLLTDPIEEDDEGDAWYTVPRKRNADTVAEPYVDTFSKVLMTSFLSPVRRDGEFVGIAGLDRSLAALGEQIGGIRVLDSGYAFAATGAGTLIAAPDRKLVGKGTLAGLAKSEELPALRDVAAGIAAGKSGRVELADPFTGKESVLFYAPVKSAGWGVVVSAPRAEVLAEVTALRRTLILVGLLALLAVAAVVVVLAARVTRPIVAVAEAADRISEGDLEIDVQVRSDDEVGRMSAAFGRMVEYLRGTAATAEAIAAGDLTVEVAPRSERDVLGTAVAGMARELRGLVGELGGAAGTLAASSQQLVATSSETGRAVEQIAGAVGEIAGGAEQQVAAVGEAQRLAEEMAGATRRGADGAEGTRAAAAAAGGAVDEGVTVAGEVAAAMARVRETTGDAAAAMRELGEKSGAIGGIVDAITTIADQTNLLALNAAIEAARAGEHGRGFAVVADEVRQLAEESRTAAGSIADLIADIQAETGRAVGIVEDGAERTADGVATVDRARAAFERIGASVGDVTARAEEIAASIDAVARLAERMQGEMGAVASVAEASSASSQEVAASAQESAASTQEITASAEHLAASAETLNRLVSRFRVER